MEGSMPLIRSIPNPLEQFPSPMSAWVYGGDADLALPAYESFDMAEAIGLLDDLAEVTGPLESNVFITYPEPPPGDERIA